MSVSIRKKIAVSILTGVVLMFTAGGASSAEAEQTYMPDSYEMHFLLDSDLALDENHELKPELRREYEISSKVKTYSLAYFETPDRSFINEGWVNRLRRKEGGKNSFELTYKKRYPVSDGNISAAMRLAESDGFDLSDEMWETEIEWGYSGMTLSVSTESNFTHGGHMSLEDLKRADANAIAVRHMPSEELNWKEESWGSTKMEAARMAGPIIFNRYKGTAFGQEVRIEVWILPGDETEANRYITELSFKTDKYEDAAAGREELTARLTEAGLLIPDDSMKTQEILNTYFNELIP